MVDGTGGGDRDVESARKQATVIVQLTGNRGISLQEEERNDRMKYEEYEVYQQYSWHHRVILILNRHN